MEEILASIRRIIADDDAVKSTQRIPEPPKPVAPSPRPAAPPVRPSASPVRPAAPTLPPLPARRVAPPEASLTEFEPAPAAPAFESVPMASAEPGDQSSAMADLAEPIASPPPPPAAAVSSFMTHARIMEAVSEVSVDEAIEKTKPEIAATAATAAAAGEASAANDATVRTADDRSEASVDELAELLSSETRAAVDSAFDALTQSVLVQNARTLEDLVREMLRPMLKAWLDDNLPSVVERLVRAEIERVSRGRIG